MNGELLRELALLSAGITASATGAALLVLRVLLSPLAAEENDNCGLRGSPRTKNRR